MRIKALPKNIFRYFICFFLILLIRLISFFYLIRFDHSFSSRIGHFVGINSIYLAKKLIENKKKRVIDFFIHDSTICNLEIERLLGKKMIFVSSFFMPIINLAYFFPGGRNHLINYKKNYYERRIIFEHRDVNGYLNKKKINFVFNNYEKFNLEKDLKKIGIRKKDKIIIINLRDDKYLKIIFPTKNFDYKTQNVNIDSYLPTIKKLNNDGYKVIRAGLHHKKKLDYKHENYLDLYSQGIRTDSIETYLLSKCLFQIGSYSGGSMPSVYLFKKPLLITNQIPLIELHSWSENIFTIFKNIYDKKRKKNISLSENFELMNTKFGPELLNGPKDQRYIKKNITPNFFTKHNYSAKDFKIIDNTEEEIFNSTFEILKKIENNSLYIKSKKNILFQKLFLKNLENYPILQKFHTNVIKSTVGDKFLRSNLNFLK